ncbi:MAG TPA: rhomboid family intramembrane serine protease [Ohtaekwangia sp.]|nr:rhomboid family intramembrane serine protease [Ohtaekwangia sp.]
MIITYSLIALTVLISFYAFNREAVISNMILNPYIISRRGQYFRFISSGFIHRDHMHLLLNMFSFYFFGGAIELMFNAYFGSRGNVYYLLLYFLGLIVADIPTYLKERNNPGYNALGASGGVAAVIFAFIIFRPLDKICLYFAFCFPGFILGMAYLLYSYYQGRRANDNINHDAHLYGALFGLAFCIAIAPSSIVNFYQEIAGYIADFFR